MHAPAPRGCPLLQWLLQTCAVALLEQRQAPPPGGWQAHTRAAAWHLHRPHPVPGIGSPARLRAINGRDPAMKWLLLLLFALTGSFAPSLGVRPGRINMRFWLIDPTM